MEPFIRPDQYQFIKSQTQILINGHASVNDRSVLHALKSLSRDKVSQLFTDLNTEQQQLLDKIIEVEDSSIAEKYLDDLKNFVVPFMKVTEQSIKKLFPKAKKLKLPPLEEVDFKEISYFGWYDKGTNKKYLIAIKDNKWVGLHGTFSPISKKGICTLCNRHAVVGLFLSETKGTSQGTYTKRGNYICQDSLKCNENLTSLKRLEDFFTLLKG